MTRATSRALLIAVVGGLFTATFATGGTLISHYLTAPKGPALLYAVSQGPRLPTSEGSKEIYLVNVRNAGERELSELVAEIELKRGTIDQGSWRASEGVTVVDNRSSTSYQVRVPLLNPGEHVSIATMMTIPEGEADPEVAARAVGVTGIRETLPTSAPASKNSSLTVLLAGGLAFATFGLLGETLLRSTRVRHAISEIDPLRFASTLDRREALNYIFLACGLDNEADKLLSHHAPVRFAEAADRLLVSGLRTSDSDRQANIMALKCMMLITGIVPVSRDNVKRALRILAKMNDEQLEKLGARAIADPIAWRDRVDELVIELSKQTPP